MDLSEKLRQLEDILRSCGSGVLAFSGGTDSALLACVGSRVLGDRLLLVTASSPTYTPAELERARDLAGRFGTRHVVIETDECSDPKFASNPPDRCFHCKSELFGRLDEIRREENLACLIDGSNADDSADFRPGERATRKFGARSPLREAGLTKAAVRELSRTLDLPTWNLPQQACLASRIPYGQPITADVLHRIAEAETFLRSLGIKMARVRHHGEAARIEVATEDIPRLADDGFRLKVVEKLRAIGYTYITLDLQGYRTGSMNETLGETDRREALAPEA